MEIIVTAEANSFRTVPWSFLNWKGYFLGVRTVLLTKEKYWNKKTQSWPPCNPFWWSFSQEKSAIQGDWLLVSVGGAEESHGKSLATSDLRVMHLNIKDQVAHPIIILSLCCRFSAALCLLFFFPRSQFKNRNCHDWNVLLLVLEENICKNYKCATAKRFIEMCVWTLHIPQINWSPENTK